MNDMLGLFIDGEWRHRSDGGTLEVIDPDTGEGISDLIRPNTQLIWTESLGSLTMEIQDVPAIARAAKSKGVPLAIDNTYAASVFSFVFRKGIEPKAVAAFVDRLKLFRIGYSWGGTASLVTIYPGLKRPGRDDGARLVRLNIGFEEPDDLIADLEQALAGVPQGAGFQPFPVPSCAGEQRGDDG